jgi:SHS family lactate transporter-like MFS transporter
LFPAELRARAVGLVYHVGAFGAAFVPMGMAALSAAMGWSLGLTIAGVVATFQVLMVLVLLLRPRSMKGLARRDDPEEGAAAAHA